MAATAVIGRDEALGSIRAFLAAVERGRTALVLSAWQERCRLCSGAARLSIERLRSPDHGLIVCCEVEPPMRLHRKRNATVITDDRGGDVLSEDERATVRRLIDEINEFNVEATGFRELLTVETDSQGPAAACRARECTQNPSA
jgi:hypothetical protein